MDFKNTSEFLINNIKIDFDRGNDVAEVLRTLIKPDTDLWKPTLKISVAAVNEKQQDNKQFEMEYNREFDEYLKRKRMYEDNLYKVYAFLWERCTKAMQNRIMAHADFQTKIYNHPLELLIAIK